MARRLACRYRCPPKLWCSQCAARRPQRCVEPMLVPDDYQQWEAEIEPADPDPLVGAIPLMLLAGGCAVVGAALLAALTGQPGTAAGLSGLALALAAIATRKELR